MLLVSNGPQFVKLSFIVKQGPDEVLDPTRNRNIEKTNGLFDLMIVAAPQNVLIISFRSSQHWEPYESKFQLGIFNPVLILPPRPRPLSQLTTPREYGRALDLHPRGHSGDRGGEKRKESERGKERKAVQTFEGRGRRSPRNLRIE
jgi:hypothetical protein